MSSAAASMVDETMTALAARRPVFHSEADFQHAFAWAARQLNPATDVRLEMRLHSQTNERLDLLLHVGDERIAVELKYPLDAAVITIEGEEFLLKNQGATDLMRFNYVTDITRIEDIVASGVATAGAAVVLTNVSPLWSAPKDSWRVAADTAFRLYEGRVLAGELAWQGDATWWHGKHPESLHLRGSYPLAWRPFASPPGDGKTSFRWTVAVID